MIKQKTKNGLSELGWARPLPSAFLSARRARRLFGFIVRLEGGQMRSATLRRVLADKFDLAVGPHSYGSLLEPGMCDAHAEIGSYCSFGKNVRRYGAAHPIDAPSMHPYFYNPALGLVPGSADVERRNITIGADVWIGSNVTILPGCSYIGMGAVVGAGSVVTRDVEDFAVVAGNPARVLRHRHSAELRQRILASRYWELEPEAAQKALGELTSGPLPHSGS